MSGKVAFLYATFPRPTETFVRRELKALGDQGFHPVVHSIWKGKSRWEGIRIHRFRLFRLWSLCFWIPFWAFRRPRAFVGILSVLWSRPCPNLQNWNETFLGLGFALVEASAFKREGYSLLHAVWATMPATAALGISKLTDIPFSMGAHAYDVFRHGGDWLLSLKFEEASLVRTTSLSSARRISQMGVDSGRVKLIRRGLGHWPQRDSFERVSASRLELLSVGRLVEKKGYLQQLELACLLEAEGLPFRLRIIGSGPLGRLLEKESHRMGLEEKVFFLGARNEERTRAAFLECDVFLFTGVVAKNGDRDGIPNVIPEALSAGCLVLTSNKAGASEAIEDGVSGYSLDPGNLGPWVSLLGEFHSSPEKFRPLREAACARAREAFDVQRTAREMRAEFDKLAN